MRRAAAAGRAEAAFGAINSQDRPLGTDEAIAMLQADPALQAVLISSRIRLDAAAIAT